MSRFMSSTAIGLALLPSLAMAQPIVGVVDYYREREAKNIFDVVKAATDTGDKDLNKLVAAAADTAAVILGAPAGLISGGLSTIGDYKPAGGNESWPKISPPSGHKICNARISQTHGANGEGGASLTYHPDSLRGYTGLYRMGLGQGRSRIRYVVEFISAPEAEYEQMVADGKCLKDGTRLLEVNWTPGGPKNQHYKVRRAAY